MHAALRSNDAVQSNVICFFTTDGCEIKKQMRVVEQ